MVQERPADVEQRGEHHVREREGGPLTRVALRVEEPLQRDLGDRDDEHERSERAEGVDEVGATEPPTAEEGGAERQALHEAGRHRETHEGEPGDRRQHVERAKHGERCVDRESEPEGRGRQPRLQDDRAGVDVRCGDERPGDVEDPDLLESGLMHRAGSTAASGIPIGSRRQNCAPYARIVSPISLPTVRSAGGKRRRKVTHG